MMGFTDGEFCSVRGLGAVMVQLGAYLAEPPMYSVLKHDWILPSGREECTRFLAKEIETVKKRLDSSVCLNLATLRLEWGLEAADCFIEAGGDFLELNVHGSYKRYLEQGKLRAMVLPENRSELFNWLREFSKVDIPIIVKFRMDVIPDYTPILDRIINMNLFGVHFNIRNEAAKLPDVNFVKNIKSKYKDMFLLVSGYVRSAEDAITLLNSGADMVGIAEPTIEDPNYIFRIAEKVRALQSG